MFPLGSDFFQKQNKTTMSIDMCRHHTTRVLLLALFCVNFCYPPNADSVVFFTFASATKTGSISDNVVGDVQQQQQRQQPQQPQQPQQSQHFLQHSQQSQQPQLLQQQPQQPQLLQQLKPRRNQRSIDDDIAWNPLEIDPCSVSKDYFQAYDDKNLVNTTLHKCCSPIACAEGAPTAADARSCSSRAYEQKYWNCLGNVFTKYSAAGHVFRSLPLSRTGISYIPDNFFNAPEYGFEDLQIIYLDFNRFDDFPSALLTPLPSLIQFYLQFNEGEMSGEGVEALSSARLDELWPDLELLHLQASSIKSLPASLCKLQNLEEMFVGGNDFAEWIRDPLPNEEDLNLLPSSIASLSLSSEHHGALVLLGILSNEYLNIVDISNCNLNDFTTIINDILGVSGSESIAANMGNLQLLTMDNNKIKNWPYFVSYLSGRINLSFRNNELTEVPKLPPQAFEV